MTYQVLARKWRPKTFSDLVGQEHVVKALQNALDEGRLHHAYLLTGTRGVGKTTIARILAKSLNCENAQHGEPCGVCQSCTQIDAGRYVDLLEIDAASNTGIDNIREVLENAQYAPTAGKYKVYIIDEVHMLSKSAFNAMLKTLEEPPEHVKFILATTDPHKVPVTVLSRCLQFVLRNMTAQQVADHLAHV
ncbi:DNA polymerase III subunit gamma/tau, partial [Neisseria gonorrhoeae]